MYQLAKCIYLDINVILSLSVDKLKSLHQSFWLMFSIGIWIHKSRKSAMNCILIAYLSRIFQSFPILSSTQSWGQIMEFQLFIKTICLESIKKSSNFLKSWGPLTVSAGYIKKINNYPKCTTFHDKQSVNFASSKHFTSWNKYQAENFQLLHAE